MRFRYLFIAAVLLVICVLPLWVLTGVPANSGNYLPEHAVLPRVWREGEQVHIVGVRAFAYDPAGSVAQRYVDRTYDLSLLRRVWFGLSPFAEWRGPAHTFVSFEFADSQFVSVSVEARKEMGESYSPWLGMLRRYELLVVIGEEADVIGLRSQVWRAPVYLYPGRAMPEQAQQLFLALLDRAESLRLNPEYYHTVLNNCATNLAAAINAVTPGRLPWGWALLLPGYADGYAYNHGLLAIDGPPERVRARYLINGRVPASSTGVAFSRAIRTRPTR